jgi:hypothetical protein
MKLLGFTLVAAGFLAGAYFLTGAGGAVLGAGFWISFIVASAGVVVLRVVTRQRKGAVEKVTAEVNTAARSLARLASGVGELYDEREAIDVYDLSREIDERFTDYLDSFVEARESIAIRFGLPVYASVMSHFAAGERYLNRVWSCSVDGYIDEAHAYIKRAHDQFTEGQGILDQQT